MTKQQVLIVGEVDKTSQSYISFAAKYECIHYIVTSKAQLLLDYQESLKNIEAIFGYWGLFSNVGGFKGEILERAPQSLKVIALCQIGYDEFDIEGMAKRGIILTNNPSTLAFEGVADLVLYNTLSSFRQFKVFDQALAETKVNVNEIKKMIVSGDFNQETGKVEITERRGGAFANMVCGRPTRLPRGHNAVIVGFGGIGQLIGQRLSSLGMNIHYVKRTRLSAHQEGLLPYKATYHKSVMDTKDIADIIILACPGTAETRNLINDEVISAMQKQIRIINVGRGYVVDESALVRGLKSGKILFAGLDVFEEEPLIHPGLIGRQDVVLTPHIGSSTIELYDEASSTCFNNIKEVLSHTENYVNRVV